MKGIWKIVLFFHYFLSVGNCECSLLINGDMYCEGGLGTLKMTEDYPNVSSIEFVNMYLSDSCGKEIIPKMVRKIKISPIQFCDCLCLSSLKYEVLILL